MDVQPNARPRRDDTRIPPMLQTKSIVIGQTPAHDDRVNDQRPCFMRRADGQAIQKRHRLSKSIDHPPWLRNAARVARWKRTATIHHVHDGTGDLQQLGHGPFASRCVHVADDGEADQATSTTYTAPGATDSVPTVATSPGVPRAMPSTETTNSLAATRASRQRRRLGAGVAAAVEKPASAVAPRSPRLDAERRVPAQLHHEQDPVRCASWWLHSRTWIRRTNRAMLRTRTNSESRPHRDAGRIDAFEEHVFLESSRDRLAAEVGRLVTNALFIGEAGGCSALDPRR